MIFHPLEMVNRGQPWSTAVNRLVYIAVFPYFIQFTQVYGYQTNYLQKICPFIGEPRLTTVNRNFEENRNFDQTVDRG